jgi:hypothetical protein
LEVLVPRESTTEDTMTEQAPPTSPGDDDLAPRRPADPSASDPDTEGHTMYRADAEQAEGEDTEAHVYVEETRNDGLGPD